MTRRLILVLGDQLTPTLSSLRDADPTHDLVLMVEVWEEATYVRHHKKKIAFLFSAMRHFAEALRADGWTVDYRTLDQTGESGSFTPSALMRTDPPVLMGPGPADAHERLEA